MAINLKDFALHPAIEAATIRLDKQRIFVACGSLRVGWVAQFRDGKSVFDRRAQGEAMKVWRPEFEVR